MLPGDSGIGSVAGLTSLSPAVNGLSTTSHWGQHAMMNGCSSSGLYIWQRRDRLICVVGTPALGPGLARWLPLPVGISVLVAAVGCGACSIMRQRKSSKSRSRRHKTFSRRFAMGYQEFHYLLLRSRPIESKASEERSQFDAEPGRRRNSYVGPSANNPDPALRAMVHASSGNDAFTGQI